MYNDFIRFVPPVREGRMFVEGTPLALTRIAQEIKSGALTQPLSTRSLTGQVRRQRN